MNIPRFTALRRPRLRTQRNPGALALDLLDSLLTLREATSVDLALELGTDREAIEKAGSSLAEFRLAEPTMRGRMKAWRLHPRLEARAAE